MRRWSLTEAVLAVLLVVSCVYNLRNRTTSPPHLSPPPPLLCSISSTSFKMATEQSKHLHPTPDPHVTIDVTAS